MTSSAPKRATVEALVRAVLGANATPTREVTFPLSLRLPLLGPGHLSVASRYFPCHRLWPAPDEAAYEEEVDGLPVELRVSGTPLRKGLSVFCEAVIGWSHVTAPDEDGNQTPCAMVFSNDARWLLVPQSQAEVKRLIARSMDLLLKFVCRRSGQGLEPDHRGHLPGRLAGRVRQARDVDDVEFDIRLPQPHGTPKFVGDYAVPRASRATIDSPSRHLVPVPVHEVLDVAPHARLARRRRGIAEAHRERDLQGLREPSSARSADSTGGAASELTCGPRCPGPQPRATRSASGTRG